MNTRHWAQLLLLAFLGLPGLLIASDGILQRVEPAFWWAGMKNPRLQLLVYGNNISETTPEITYKGVRLDRTIKVKSPNYLFLDLLIIDQKPASFDIQFRKDGQAEATYTYRLLGREPGSALRQGFDPSDVMYLITPDRFVNGNPANDNSPTLKEKTNRAHPGGRHGGDIEGIIKSLDYIQDMGFTALWINPLVQNDQPEYSYHGYSITDFYAIDARYGAMEEYLRLCRLAREKGLKMIMDMVVNHCGSEHWWMKDLPSDDWVNFNNRFVPTNHRRTTVQDPYASEWDHRNFVDGWFVATMPDMNQQNPLLATYLIQNSIWWVEYAGLAGIRMDTYPYPDKEYMTEWTCRMMEEYPNLNIVGEEWTENPALVAHWQRGKGNPNGYTSCLPSVMDFPVQGALWRALTEKDDWGSGWIRLYEMLANDFLYADPLNLVIFPDNHDMDRFFTQVNQDFDLFRLGMTYLLTLRGIPQIYYGTEILMTNPVPHDHGLIRSDFPGGWPGDSVNAFTGKGLREEQKQAQEFMRKLLNWRKDQPVIHSGRLKHFSPENGVYVYFRYDDQKTVMVVLNKSDQEQALDLKRFEEVLEGPAEAREVLSDRTYKVDGMLLVPARTPLILEMGRGH